MSYLYKTLQYMVLSSVTSELLEAYSIDAELLNQFLNDDILPPSIDNEIALHLLSNHYQTRLKSNRLQLRLNSFLIC